MARAALFSHSFSCFFLGAFKAYKSRDAFKSTISGSNSSYKSQFELYNSQKLIAETQIKSLNKQIDAEKKYKSQSILMNIDPYNEYRNTATYYIAVNDKNPNTVKSLLKAYQSLIGGDYVYNEVKSDLSYATKEWMINELIKVDIGNQKSVSIIQTDDEVKEDSISSGSYGGSVFTVTTVGNTDSLSDNLMKAVEKQIEEKQPDIAASIGAHTIKLINSTSGLSVDNELASKISSFSDDLKNMQQSLTDTKTALDGLTEPEGAQVITKQGALKSVLKYALIGLVAGFILALFWFFIKYIVSGRISSESDLESRFGLKVLGTIASSEKNGFWQRLSDKMLHIRRDKGLSDQCSFIGEYISGMKISDLSLALVTSLSEDKSSAIIDSLNTGRDFKIHYCGNITDDSNAVKILNESQGALILLDMEKTTEARFEEMIRILSNCGKKIVGVIIYR
jgi:capsular polysaccharide biosynthesis protein